MQHIKIHANVKNSFLRKKILEESGIRVGASQPESLPLGKGERLRGGFEGALDDSGPLRDGLEAHLTDQILLRGRYRGHPCLPGKTHISRLLFVSQLGSHDFKNSRGFRT
jgi:hypothetical protein